MSLQYVPRARGMLNGLRIVTVPEEDQSFADDVRAAVARLDGVKSGPTQAVIMSLLTDQLPIYPRLMIHQQDGLASFEAEPRTWYVYRDGSARPTQLAES